jgi:uncharacterized repeat protein (TIGR01451 family)
LFVASSRVALALLTLSVTGAIAVVLAGAASPSSTGSSALETLVAACPSASDVTAIDAAVSLKWESDPTAGTTACTAAQSGRSLTLFQERVYQSFLVMRSLRYSRPLPWTALTLYDWFTHTIKAVRFRGDIAQSSCCEPADTINITTTVLIAQKDLPPSRKADMAHEALGFVSLLAHEARHNENKPHTCGAFDLTIAEQGAIAIQLELGLWDALYSGSFLDGPDATAGSRHASFRDDEFAVAQSFLAPTTICDAPTADLASTMTATPRTAAPGGTVTLATTVANGGPGDATSLILFEDTPTGTTPLSATSSQGSCSVQTDRTVCDLGALSSGAAATANVVYKVTAAAGPSFQGWAVRYADVHDPSNRNDVATAFVNVQAASAALPKCKKGQKSTPKHRCRR